FQFEQRPQIDLKSYTAEYVRRVRESWVEARNTLRAPHLGRLLVDSAVAVGVPIEAVDMQRCLEAYAWRKVRDTVLFPEVLDTLNLLRDRGIQLGIVTNSYHPMTLRDLELQEYGILDYFPDCRITAADAGYLKPHPAIFEQALQQLGISADEAIFVGDNPVADIAGAQGAGMRAVLRRKRDRLPTTSSLVIPDAMIFSLSELPAILDDWFKTEA
ncbi:MAG: HAD family hydrolase, partial [Armatimonadetes bacterium]|nr:HAD family hydrolase [Anaerolineae bacterium]